MEGMKTVVSPRMQTPPSRSSLFPAFAVYIHKQREAIGRTWMPLVRKSLDVPDALLISRADLKDHVPQLIDDLVKRLHQENDEDQKVTAGRSRSHGRDQWRAGYNISELIWEIYIIRRVLTETILVNFSQLHPEYPNQEVSAARYLVCDFFHQLTCHSVSQFMAEQHRLIEEKNHILNHTNETREKLTRTVSHELRNILNALTLTIGLLGEEVSEKARKEMGLVCSRMLFDMARILNNLLNYSSLMAGQARPLIEDFSLNELCHEIVSQWQPLTRELDLVLEYHFDDQLKIIRSDRLKLKQIAGNFLSNAIKYRKPGLSGVITLSFYAFQEKWWKMEVVDSGIGIAPEDMNLLFTEYARIKPTSAIAGTGLGLSICKEFIELLGGEIQAYSKVGEGSHFEIKLPIHSS